MTLRAKIFCLLVLLASFGVLLTRGGTKYPTQGSGAKALLARARASASAPPLPPALIVVPVTNRYYFAATATDNYGQVSDYSNETNLVRTGGWRTVTLAWDRSPGTNVITNYAVLWGGASRSYTNLVNAGTNLSKVVQVLPPMLTNIVVSVTTVNATNLAWAPAIKGLWTMVGATNYSVTNPASSRLFRAVGKKGSVPKLAIKGTWF